MEPETKTRHKQAKTPSRKLAREAAKFGVKFVDNWDKYSRKRLTQITNYELSYYGSVKPTLKGRSNIPFPALAKYVDELKGRLDTFPNIKVENHRLAQLIVNKKVQGAIDIFKKPDLGDWARKDRMGRISAIFAGFGAVDFFTERDEDGVFYANADPIDHNDFVHEPMGGSDLEQHSAVGRFPIFRTVQQLEQRAADGIYDAKQVEKIKAKLGGEGFKANDKYFQGRYERYKALGLDPQNNDYIGQDAVSLVMLQMTHPTDGQRYLVVFEYKTGEWVRFEKMKKVYGSSKYSIKLWQTHEDPNVVMCKAPVDDIYPLAEAMRVKINQLMDNHTKRIWGQRAIDPNFFPDPEDMEWRRPDQIIIGKSYNGKPMSQGVYEFKTEDATAGTLEFMKFMDSFLAGVVGINPGEVSEESKKVGVFFGQLQKTAARLGILNKSYSEMWERGVKHLIHGIKKNMNNEMMVQTLGTRGAEWHEFSAEELGDPQDFEVVATSSDVETEMNESRKNHRKEALKDIITDPDLKQQVNPRWLVEQRLAIGEYPEAEIRRALDVKTYGSEEMLSHADAAVEQILKGKSPKLYHGADVSFFEYIFNFGMDMDDETPEEMDMKNKVMMYGMAHSQIVAKNMALRAVTEQAAAGVTADKMKGPLDKTKPPAKPVVVGKGGKRAPSQGVVPIQPKVPPRVAPPVVAPVNPVQV